jgi:tRNA A-37 threonylcarbamoyl transferase component Bud32
MELGERLGEGAGAEAYAWADGQIVKLFKSGADRRVVEHEARVTRAASDSGAPAPRVFGTVEIDGRIGIIMQRYGGATLLTAVRRGAITPAEGGVVLARLHHAIHAPCYEPAVTTFRTWALYMLGQLEKKGIPPDVLETVRAIVMELPESGPLCHGDLHADNVLMTPDGPVAIDWISALRADPMVDIARQHLTLTVLPAVALGAEAGAFDQLRREADAAFIETYATLSGTTPGALIQAIEPYMTVMAAMRMMEPGSDAAEQRLLNAYIRKRAARP